MNKNYTSKAVGRDAQLRKRKTTGLLSSRSLAVLVLFLASLAANAQVSSALNPTYGYTFANAAGTYTALTGGTVAQSGTAINTDAVSPAVALPFTFTFNGIKEKSVYLSNNGFITFGIAPTTSNYSPMSSAEGYDGAIAGFGANLVASSVGSSSAEIRYGTNTGGDFVVQYKDLAVTAASQRITFQIILSVDGKTIKIVYGPNCSSSVNTTGQVGIRGTNDEDWYVRTLGNNGNWNNVNGGSAGSPNSDTMPWRTTNTLPASGQTYSFSPTSYVPTYLVNPVGVVQEFTSWVNGSGPNNVPTTNFATNGYGNSSWQIDNVAATAATSGWASNGTSGEYTPRDYVSASGGHSARFHSFEASSPQVGYLDYYVNLSSNTGTPTVDFYHINPTGTDILEVFLSTDGGATFTKLGASLTTNTAWTAVSRSLGSANSATTIIRFKATADFGANDIGIDHLTITPPPVAPAITGIAPSANFCANGGQTVTISGSGFIGTTSVKFNNVAAASFSIVSATSITAVTPSGLTAGTITVTNPVSTATSGAYTVAANPTIGVTPTSASYCAPGGTPINLAATGAATYAWTGTGTPGLSATTGDSVTSNPTTTTTITVTGTDANGCTNTAASTITVGSKPQGVTATATPAALCSGGIATLSATGFTVPFTAKQYVFSTSTGATLDPMTDAATLINGPAVGSGSGDDTATSVQSIGFTFNYEGTNYTQYSVSPDGWLLLGSSSASAQFTNTTTSTTNVPKIYPLWDDLSVGTNGSVKALVTGSSPNRILKLQWFVTNPRVVTGAADTTFQLWLYENTNAIEFRYGTNGTSASSSAGLTGSTSTNFQSINFSANTASTTTAKDNNTTGPAAGRMYSFIPSNSVSYSWTGTSTSLTTPSTQNTTTAALSANETFTVIATNPAAPSCVTAATVTVSIINGASIGSNPVNSSKCAGETATFTVGATGPGLVYHWRKGGVNINTVSNPSAATATLTLSNLTAADSATYDVIVSADCGSPVTSQGAVLTVSAPIAAISASATTICSGQGVTLSENGGNATSWSWSPDGSASQNIAVSPTTTTTYTVTATYNGCSATASKTIIVNAAPAAVTVTPSSIAICQGSSTTLTASGGVAATTLTLGTDTTSSVASSVTSSLGPNPMQSYYGGAKQQTIILASELTAMGLSSGSVITSIAFNLNNAETSRTLNSFRIKMQATALSAFADLNFVTTGLTVVRPAAAYTPVAGWNTIPLTTNFTWNGTSNLLIETNFSDNDTGGSGTSTALYSATSFVSTLFYRADSTSAANVNNADTALYSYSQRNNIQLGVNVPATYSWSPSQTLSAASGASVTATPTGDTTYTAKVTVNGCESSNTASVTIKPLPTLTISGAINPACGATTVNLSSVVTSNGTVTYFSDSDYTVAVPNAAAVNTAGTYYVRATSAGNCTKDATITVNAFRPNPTLSVSGAITPACGATTADLTSVVTSNGTLSYFSDNAYSISVVTPTAVTVAGTYYVRATSVAGCIIDGVIVVNAFKANPIVTASNVSGCSGTPIALSGSGTPTGGSGSFSVANPYTGTSSTTYTYTYTAPNGCQVTSAPANITITAQPLWYLDADGDHYYTGSAVASCTSPGAGYTTSVLGGGDCDDSNAGIYPGATEICYNGILENCSGTLSQGCAPVVVNMTPSYNNTTLTSLSQAIPAVAYSYGNFTNLKYRFSITNTTTGVTAADIIQTSRYVTIPASLHSYPGTYTIKASAVINEEIVAYAGNTITVTAPTVQVITLSSANCGATLASLSATLAANAGPNATGYTFRIRTNDANPTPTYATSQSATRYIGANTFTGFPLQYSASYKISVRYTYNDPVTNQPVEAPYGAECTVNTPSIPLTNMASPTCGSQVTAMNANMSAAAASYATSYQFRIRLFSDNSATPTYYYSVPNASRFSSLTAFQGITLAYNTGYSISVQYSVLNGSTTVWSGYGPECKVTTPFFPTTSLVPSQCGQQTATSLTQQLNITPYPGFPNYKVKLDEVSGEDIVNSQEIIVSYSYFKLSQFSIAQLGKNYNVSVAIKLNGVFGDYDTACDLHTPGNNADGNNGGGSIVKTLVPFKATAYPNPFANDFMIDVKTSSQSIVNLKVYDMIGRMIEQREVKVSDMESTLIGNSYPSGVYNVVVSQDDSVETVRVVKK